MGEPPCFSSISNIPGLQANYSNIDSTMSDVKDKTGQPIEVGDHVYTKIRGGRHEGDVRCSTFSIYGAGLMDAGHDQVSEIVTDKQEAEEKGIKNPPKVRFPPASPCTVSLVEPELYAV
jgi:hypothetical protein